MRRNLAAVLAADVAGYSRLMGEDAGATLSALMRLRTEVFGPCVSARHGRVVKNMGDGWIVVFAAARDAVQCAMQIQDRLVPEPTIRLRMGLDLGDVAETGDDVFGEAVNVAARLQEIAQPGAIAVSEAVFGALDGTLRPSFENRGPVRLRNIALPVGVRVRGGELAGGSMLRTPEGFPALAIRPISAPGGRPEVGEIAEALTGDFLSRLGGTHWLRCRVAMEPDPGAYVLSGTLRAQGDRLRLEAALTAPDGEPLWTGRHEGSLAEAFQFQDAAVPVAATAAFRRLLAHAARGIDATPAPRLTARQWALRAIIRGGADGPSHRAALDCLAEAIRLEPGWGYPYALALAIVMGAVSLGLGRHVEPYLARQAEWIERVEALEPPVSPARIMLAFARLVHSHDPGAVRADVRTQLQGLPFEPDVLIWAGYIHLYLGEPREALDCFETFDRCVRLDAYLPAVRAGAAGAMLQLGRFETALELARTATALAPGYPSPLRIAASACGHLGLAAEGAAALAALERVSPGETVSGFRRRSGYCESPATAIYFEGLRRAGMPD